jgi:hypothetical protein
VTRAVDQVRISRLVRAADAAAAERDAALAQVEKMRWDCDNLHVGIFVHDDALGLIATALHLCQHGSAPYGNETWAQWRADAESFMRHQGRTQPPEPDVDQGDDGDATTTDPWASTRPEKAAE